MVDPNEVSMLARREIEARIAIPLSQGFMEELGEERTLQILDRVIRQLARESGSELARVVEGNTLEDFMRGLEYWKRDDAIQIQVLRQNSTEFHFNVTRCRYAEMYRDLGFQHYGSLMSCNRDFALVEGFNPEILLTRTQTIMEGAPHCDFRFHLTCS